MRPLDEIYLPLAMKLSPSLPVCLLALAFALTASAGNLDAPVGRPVTVGSEILRGYIAATNATIDNPDPEQAQRAMDHIYDEHVQERTASDAFTLGWNFGGWQSLWVGFSTGKAYAGGTKSAGERKQAAIRRADGFYRDFRELCRKLEITDDQMKQLVAGIYDPAHDNALWEAAVKSGSYQGSYPVRKSPAAEQ